MSTVRDLQQSDFDLERVITMLDEALTSKDERVQDALRQLLVIVTLTKTQEDGRMAIERSHGPLRQMQQDISDLNRRIGRISEDIYELKNKQVSNPYSTGPWGSNPNAPYTLAGGASVSAQSLLDYPDKDVTITK